MAEEIRLHLEQREREHKARGMSAEDARHAALRQFGGVEQVKEVARSGRRWRWAEDLIRDARFGGRVFAKAPVLSAVIVFSLACGLGANTAVFSWVRAVVLHPLPAVPHGDQLVIVEQRTQSGSNQWASRPELNEMREQCPAFAGLFGQGMTVFNLSDPNEDTRVWTQCFSHNGFSVLGLKPAAGRFFVATDDVPGAPITAVISHRLWQQRFGAKEDAIGQTLRLNGHSVTVIGVAPIGFQGGFTALSFDVWVPSASWGELFGTGSRDERASRMLQVVGRLKPGVSRGQARNEIRAYLEREAVAHPQTHRGVEADVVPFWQGKVGAQAKIVPTLVALQVVTLLLLAIVCVNTANLLLAHAAVRGREIAIRLSLGASRGRVIRQLLAEGLLLAGLGAVLGAGVAYYGLELINRIPKPAAIPVAITAQLDVAELFFAGGLAVGCSILFGLAPAWQSTRGDLAEAMKVGGRTGAPRRRRFQQCLVGAEVALALLIVVLAGLFWKSFHNAQHFHPGFESRGVMLGSIDLNGRGYTRAQVKTLLDNMLADIRAVPGVEAASIASWVPLDLVYTLAADFELEGASRDAEGRRSALWYEASRGYFETMRIPLVAGTDFSGPAASGGQLEAVVNEEFVRRFVPDGQPVIGRKLEMHKATFRIVGVAGHAKYNTLHEPPQPALYLSLSGTPWPRMNILVRSARDPAEIYAAVRACVRRADVRLAFLENRTLAQHVANSLVLRAIPAKILAVVGPLAVFLAATGLYSVLAYAVSQRTHEIGVRMTLGASAARVILLILRQGMTAVLIGAAVGLVAAYFASVRLSVELVGVPAGDTAVFVALPLLLVSVAMVACFIPARRAAKVDPMVALRAE